ncbi:Peptidase S10 serine carboxypeptidase [Macrophomina phaseolina MS6]|uniref:Peptidase S10 serine carboxypeptidase n=2 Tax=Macrophomina phaseolina TaxID=35725 RepID=K2SH17_MACPH|nr:Peptidase S10 serine carboxypeptidase [Macrophomina phaseolina MS6]
MGDTGWYGSSFLFALGASQPILGKLYSEFSVRGTFTASVVLFAVSSVMCALSNSSAMFIASRTLCGLGSGGMTTGTIIISYHVIPEHLRPLCNGLVGVFETLATILGPIVGGVLASGIGWRWAFWINLPVAALVAAPVLLLYRGCGDREEASASTTWAEKIARLDLDGGALLTASILCLLFGVQQIGQDRIGALVGLLVAFAVLLAAAGFHQHRKGAAATFPPHMFGKRSFSACLLYGFFMKASEAVVYYQLPPWFQTVKCASPRGSALMLMPSLIALIGGSVISGVGASLVCRRLPPFMLAGAAIACAGAVLLRFLETDAGPARWIGYQIPYGFGCGMGLQLSIVGVQVALDAGDVAFGSSVAMVARILGAAIFIFVAQVVYIGKLAGLGDILPGANADTFSACDLKHSAGFKAALDLYNRATGHAMIVAVVLIFCVLPSAALVSWTPLKKEEKHAKTEPVPDN